MSCTYALRACLLLLWFIYGSSLWLSPILHHDAGKLPSRLCRSIVQFEQASGVSKLARAEGFFVHKAMSSLILLDLLCSILF